LRGMDWRVEGSCDKKWQPVREGSLICANRCTFSNIDDVDTLEKVNIYAELCKVAQASFMHAFEPFHIHCLVLGLNIFPILHVDYLAVN
jgi:hypothetical protein